MHWPQPVPCHPETVCLSQLVQALGMGSITSRYCNEIFCIFPVLANQSRECVLRPIHIVSVGHVFVCVSSSGLYRNDTHEIQDSTLSVVNNVWNSVHVYATLSPQTLSKIVCLVARLTMNRNQHHQCLEAARSVTRLQHFNALPTGTNSPRRRQVRQCVPRVSTAPPPCKMFH